MMRTKLTLLGIAVTLFFMAKPVGAAILTYTSESSFLAAMSAPNMESFETFITSSPTPADFITMTDFTMSALPASGHSLPSNSPALHPQLGPDFTLSISATDGTAFVRYDSDLKETLRFTFNLPQQGFGLNIVDWGDWGIGSLILTDNLGNSFTVATTPQNDGNQLFFGIVNTQTTFTQIELLSEPTLNTFGIDEVYYGTTVVPIPSTALLLGMGLMCLAGVRKRVSHVPFP